MKFRFTIQVALVFFALIIGVSAAEAKIWRVNSTPGINADFTTLAAAHTGAASGDTLHLEGSATTYGSLTCSKKLIIIGPGYFLGENPSTQAVAITALVNAISFNVGSEGSVVMGCDFTGSAISIFCSDIVIRRNKFSSPNGAIPDWSNGIIYLYWQSNNSGIGINNIIISQNYGVYISGASRASNGLLITNNYLGLGAGSGDATNSSSISLNDNTVAIIQNNIFRRGRINSQNCSFTNNIMVAGSIVGTGNLFANNLANADQFGSTNGNQANVDMSTVFIGSGSGISSDGMWKLKAGSPAIGSGFGSTVSNPVDAGMYGNNTSYVLSGMPPIPSIYFFENQPVGSNTDPIDVSIKAKSHN